MNGIFCKVSSIGNRRASVSKFPLLSLVKAGDVLCYRIQRVRSSFLEEYGISYIMADRIAE